MLNVYFVITTYTFDPAVTAVGFIKEGDAKKHLRESLEMELNADADNGVSSVGVISEDGYYGKIIVQNADGSEDITEFAIASSVDNITKKSWAKAVKVLADNGIKNNPEAVLDAAIAAMFG